MQKYAPQFNQLLVQLRRIVMPIVRYRVVISIVAVCGVMILSVITVNQILTMPEDQQYLDEKRQEGINTRFDQNTITKVEQLKDRQQSTDLTLPSGRISPFTE